MQIINYISSAAIPTVILIIIMYGVTQKVKVYDTFIDGAKEGIEIVFRLFPTLIGIFLAVGALRNSGIIDLIINIISPVTSLLKIPSQVLPLAMLRPISGSAFRNRTMLTFNVFSSINCSLCQSSSIIASRGIMLPLFTISRRKIPSSFLVSDFLFPW